MTWYVNNDWETAGVRSVNAGPQPGVAEIPLPDDHEDIAAYERRLAGILTVQEKVDRDIASRPIQAIIGQLNNEALIRQILTAEYSG